MPWYSASNSSSAPKTVTPFIVLISESLEECDLYRLCGILQTNEQGICADTVKQAETESCTPFVYEQFTSGIISLRPAFPRNLLTLERNKVDGWVVLIGILFNRNCNQVEINLTQ